MSIIKEYRKKQKITQQELAQELGVVRQTIMSWERKESTPTLQDANKISEFLKIPLTKLIKDYKEE